MTEAYTGYTGLCDNTIKYGEPKLYKIDNTPDRYDLFELVTEMKSESTGDVQRQRKIFPPSEEATAMLYEVYDENGELDGKSSVLQILHGDDLPSLMCFWNLIKMLKKDENSSIDFGTVKINKMLLNSNLKQDIKILSPAQVDSYLG